TVMDRAQQHVPLRTPPRSVMDRAQQHVPLRTPPRSVMDRAQQHLAFRTTPQRGRSGGPTLRVGGMGSDLCRNPRTFGPPREARGSFAPSSERSASKMYDPQDERGVPISTGVPSVVIYAGVGGLVL